MDGLKLDTVHSDFLVDTHALCSKSVLLYIYLESAIEEKVLLVVELDSQVCSHLLEVSIRAEQHICSQQRH